MPSLPPNFTVVTFPSPSPMTVEPFIVPFAWAYCLYHSLSFDDAASVQGDIKSIIDHVSDKNMYSRRHRGVGGGGETRNGTGSRGIDRSIKTVETIDYNY